MDIKIKKEWEKRSLHFKDSIKGVMLSSFPDFVNESIHEWQISTLRDFFPRAQKKIKVLDIGCGYGRLSFELSRQFKNAEYHGIDISEEYVRLFNEKLKGRGKALYGRADNIPFTNRVFDYVFIATTLIYMSDGEIKKLIQKLKKIVKENALVIIIENNRTGINYINGFGMFNIIKKIIRKKNKFHISSKAFREKEIENFFKEDFLLVEKRRCTLLTLFLPLFFLSGALNLNIFSFIVPNINLPFLPTLFTSYIFRVKPYEKKEISI